MKKKTLKFGASCKVKIKIDVVHTAQSTAVSGLVRKKSFYKQSNTNTNHSWLKWLQNKQTNKWGEQRSQKSYRCDIIRVRVHMLCNIHWKQLQIAWLHVKIWERSRWSSNKLLKLYVSWIADVVIVLQNFILQTASFTTHPSLIEKTVDFYTHSVHNSPLHWQLFISLS